MDKKNKKYCILCLHFGHQENVCGYKDWICNLPLDLYKNFDLEYKKKNNFKEWKKH